MRPDPPVLTMRTRHALRNIHGAWTEAGVSPVMTLFIQCSQEKTSCGQGIVQPVATAPCPELLTFCCHTSDSFRLVSVPLSISALTGVANGAGAAWLVQRW
jgi:hypothetical protein